MESDEDPFYTDEDEEYVPSSTSESDANEDDFDTGTSEVLSISEAPHITPSKTRKRLRRPSEWKVNKIKYSRTKGTEYVSNNKVHKNKSLQPYQHICRYKCNLNICEEKRQELFKAFYDLPSYDHQTAFLSSCIKKSNVKRKKIDSATERKFSTNIFLLEKRVCKQFFLKTFDISNKRFSSVCAKTNHLGIAEPDRRGKGQTHRRMGNDQRSFVINHIKRFPRYTSHYSRKENSQTKYLSSDLNKKIMYDLYKSNCEDEGTIPVKLSYYRYIFNSEFNLRFHRPHSDTCSRCDSYQNIIKHSTDESKVSNSRVQLALHQKRAENAVNMKKSDIDKHRLSTDTVVVCFDLQQSLPTPLLSTSKVFYLRQLWTYNFCIYNLITNEAHMYVWSENIASRGSQEIGSCLLHFVKSLPANIKRLIAYSDSCGGQNKNKNICKLFMFLVKATQLEEIEHKFLEPGHTYMECDRSFGLIEKCKKKIPQVFIPSDWIYVIRLASKRFVVHSMKKDHYFYSFAHLNAIISDPKKDVERKSLNFRQICHFKYSKHVDVYSFHFKNTLNEDFPFSTCNCPYLGKGRPANSLEKMFRSKLYEDSLSISTEKWKNLQSLMEYIPPRHHDFYNGLKHGHKQIQKKVNKRKQNNIGAAASTSKHVTAEGSNDTTDSESEEVDMTLLITDSENSD